MMKTLFTIAGDKKVNPNTAWEFCHWTLSKCLAHLYEFKYPACITCI